MCRCINSDENEGNILVGCCQRQSRASSFVLDIFTLQPCVRHVDRGMFPELPLCRVGGFITVFHRQTLANLLLKSGNSKQSLCGAVLRNTQNTVMQPMHTFSRCFL